MRGLLVAAGVLGASAPARADLGVAAGADEPSAGAVSVGAAVGAGGQGPATYGALELRLDAAWPDDGVAIGLGGRAVWADGVFRRADWARPIDAVTLVRDVRVTRALGDDAQLAAAAGGLAPSQLGFAADGYRAALDDQPRTGARIALATPTLVARAEIDDVLDPALVGGAARWRSAGPWGAAAAVAVDPGGGTGVMAAAPHVALDLGATRALGGGELGAALLVAPGAGAGIALGARRAVAWGDLRIAASLDARAGTGELGAAFGPLYRAERVAVWRVAGLGAGAGAAVRAELPRGWLVGEVRARPGLSPLAALSVGAPLGRAVQAAGWLAVARDAQAGAAELRVAWARRLFSSLQLAQMIHADGVPAWSLTAWFGAAT